jgi:hypothetical protein
VRHRDGRPIPRDGCKTRTRAVAPLGSRHDHRRCESALAADRPPVRDASRCSRLSPAPTWRRSTIGKWLYLTVRTGLLGLISPGRMGELLRPLPPGRWRSNGCGEAVTARPSPGPAAPRRSTRSPECSITAPVPCHRLSPVVAVIATGLGKHRRPPAKKRGARPLYHSPFVRSARFGCFVSV